MPAGTYHIVLDCMITDPVTVTFDLIWRRNTSDTIVATFTSSYQPLADGSYNPQSFTHDAPGTAIDFQDGDQLVFRYTADADSPPMSYEPNGDGPGPDGTGHFPSITLPL